MANNPINPRKLLHSKWTAVQPQDRQKHHLVVAVKFSKSGQVNHCQIEAVLTKNVTSIDWTTLKDPAQWLPGWR